VPRAGVRRGDEADDGGPWPAARGGVPSGPAGTARGNLLEDVRGRIPVQGWPEFSESREQLNSSGAAGPDGAHTDSGLAAVGGPAGADDLVVEDDARYDDEAEHAAWLSGIRGQWRR
jgi:hypothetical protein